MTLRDLDRPASPVRHLISMMTVSYLLPHVGPDFGAVGGASELRRIAGALLTYSLVVAVLMIVICAATWAISSSTGNWHAASKARAGFLVALGGAALTGGALAWANWLLDLGATL
jgi:hypothetical protein